MLALHARDALIILSKTNLLHSLFSSVIVQVLGERPTVKTFPFEIGGEGDIIL